MVRTITVLKRYGHKGQFVKYPSNWQKRLVHTGKRRHDTSCDLLIGLCACGERHMEDELWVQEMLERTDSVIEPHEDWLARMRSKNEVIKY